MEALDNAAAKLNEVASEIQGIDFSEPKDAMAKVVEAAASALTAVSDALEAAKQAFVDSMQRSGTE